MHPDRIAELLEPFLQSTGAQPLTITDLQHISTYIDLLQRWNARINLTAIRTEPEIVTRHFGESLFAATHLYPNRQTMPAPSLPFVIPNRGEAAPSACPELAEGNTLAPPDARRLTPDAQVADIGSGAGFPGLPLKLWAPFIHLTLIESNHKKSAFLREVTRALTLMNINIQTARAESLLAVKVKKEGGFADAPEPAPNVSKSLAARARYDLVTLRAVERFDQILPTASVLVTPGGRLALLIGKAQAPQAQALVPTFHWDTPIPIPKSTSRVLLLAHRPRVSHDST